MVVLNSYLEHIQTLYFLYSTLALHLQLSIWIAIDSAVLKIGSELNDAIDVLITLLICHTARKSAVIRYTNNNNRARKNI